MEGYESRGEINPAKAKIDMAVQNEKIRMIQEQSHIEPEALKEEVRMIGEKSKMDMEALAEMRITEERANAEAVSQQEVMRKMMLDLDAQRETLIMIQGKSMSESQFKKE